MRTTTTSANPGDHAVVIAPDSFKGSLGADAAARALADGVQAAHDGLTPVCRGLSDGGEGFLACLLAAGGGTRHHTRVVAVHGGERDVAWLTRADGTAAIESAQVLGLPLIGPDGPAVDHRDSRGLGRLVRAALDAGHRRMVIGLGGSATNDAGLGLLTALGVRVRDAHDQPATPDPAGIPHITVLDWRGLDPRLHDCELTALCDVDNPLTGANGCTHVYGPQKGLAPDRAAATDAALARFARLAAAHPTESAGRPGAGAAGGLGFALSLLGARLAPGAAEVLRLVDLDAALAGAAAVITGEGRADAQTLHGKLPAAVAERARAHGCPVYLVAGSIDPEARPALAERFNGHYSLTELAGGGDNAMCDAAHWLRQAGQRIAGPLLR